MEWTKYIDINDRGVVQTQNIKDILPKAAACSVQIFTWYLRNDISHFFS